MSKAKPPFRRPWSEVTAVEYVLIASLIAIFILAALQTVETARAAF